MNLDIPHIHSIFYLAATDNKKYLFFSSAELLWFMWFFPSHLSSGIPLSIPNILRQNRNVYNDISSHHHQNRNVDGKIRCGSYCFDEVFYPFQFLSLSLSINLEVIVCPMAYVVDAHFYIVYKYTYCIVDDMCICLF